MTQLNRAKRAVIDQVTIYHDDVQNLYEHWPTPDVIISDGGYGVSGFKGDAKTPAGLHAWYENHLKGWAKAKAGTTLWFWNTEIGWATVHPLLQAYGWDYLSCNTWNKGIQHIAGNCNLSKLKHPPIVTEVCVQYVKRAEFQVGEQTLSLKQWLREEWMRTGLPLYKTNEACGVSNAASRKYFTKDHLWYAPPAAHFEKLVSYANQYGKTEGRPYFSVNGQTPLSKAKYERLFAKFNGQYGITNVWDHPPLHSAERIRIKPSSKYAHLNQKPIKLIKYLIETSSNVGDVIWEPFGGLCTTGVVAQQSNRRAWCAEINPVIFQYAVQRLQNKNPRLSRHHPQPLD